MRGVRALLAALLALTACGVAAAPPSGEVTRPPDDLESALSDGQDAIGPASAPVRVQRPAVPPGPRRIGLQAGHWLTNDVPDELRRLEYQTGASWEGIPEWRLNLDIATRVAQIFRGRGYLVDVLPTSVPAGYLADVFVALHADGDPEGLASGFKAAHGVRRGPFEERLVRDLVEEYARATGLAQDDRINRNMLFYYPFSWTRYRASIAPHTPAAILEMGYLTSAADRQLLLGDPDRAATGIAKGIQRFLDETPRELIFSADLVVSPLPTLRPAAPSARP